VRTMVVTAAIVVAVALTVGLVVALSDGPQPPTQATSLEVRGPQQPTEAPSPDVDGSQPSTEAAVQDADAPQPPTGAASLHADAPQPPSEETATAHAERLALLAAVECWAPVFSMDDPGVVTGYDMVVVDGVPDWEFDTAAGPAEIARWNEQGTLAIAYMSVGTAEEWRHYDDEVDPDWVFEEVPDWPGEYYVDAREPGWRELVVDAAQELADRGFDGIYLDYIDVVDDHPETTEGMLTLVDELRDALPELLIIGQNGQTIAGALPIDAISQEQTWGDYDDGYQVTPAEESAELLGGLRELHADGLPVFTLDYTPASDAFARDIVERSLAEGFKPAVTTLELEDEPHTTPCTIEAR
jgi:cysteinyl-tRNA synthetase, unknown class